MCQNGHVSGLSYTFLVFPFITNDKPDISLVCHAHVWILSIYTGHVHDKPDIYVVCHLHKCLPHQLHVLLLDLTCLFYSMILFLLPLFLSPFLTPVPPSPYLCLFHSSSSSLLPSLLPLSPSLRYSLPLSLLLTLFLIPTPSFFISPTTPTTTTKTTSTIL